MNSGKQKWKERRKEKETVPIRKERGRFRYVRPHRDGQCQRTAWKHVYRSPALPGITYNLAALHNKKKTRTIVRLYDEKGDCVTSSHTLSFERTDGARFESGCMGCVVVVESKFGSHSVESGWREWKLPSRVAG